MLCHALTMLQKFGSCCLSSRQHMHCTRQWGCFRHKDRHHTKVSMHTLQGDQCRTSLWQQSRTGVTICTFQCCLQHHKSNHMRLPPPTCTDSTPAFALPDILPVCPSCLLSLAPFCLLGPLATCHLQCQGCHEDWQDWADHGLRALLRQGGTQRHHHAQVNDFS
jgi:hypothetical protein